ncbi:lytic transglycosylase domain-containing protein, partial [Rhizobium ruizarguesonis]
MSRSQAPLEADASEVNAASAAAAEYGIPEGILYSVGLTETGRKGSLYPYAMNVEGKAIFPPSEQDEMRQFDVARNSGAKLIDIGCMQI